MIRVPNLLTRLFKDKTEVAIFLTAFLVEITFGLYLVYRWGFTSGSGDALSHLYIARTVVDNQSPNYANLGANWLPLFHLLIMPLTLINLLYATGFAGTIVNAFATGGICLFLYRLVGRGKLGVLASAIFLLNAFTLIGGVTSMDERVALLFIILSVYYFKNYWEKDDMAEFMKCCLCLILGTLTRYEVWSLTLPIAFFFTLKEVKNNKKYRLAYAHLPFWGIFAWLFWNLAIFRDPLMFIRNPIASVLTQLSSYEVYCAGSILLTTKHTVLQFYNFSGFLYIATFLSIILLFIYRRSPQIISVLLLLSPIAFHWYSAFSLISLGYTRYFYMGFGGLLSAPFLFATSFTSKRNKKPLQMKTKLMRLSVILITCLLLLPSFPIGMNILSSGLQTIRVGPSNSANSFDYTSIYNEGKEFEAIKERMTGSTILISGERAVSGRFSAITATSPSLIFDVYDNPLHIDAMERPWKCCLFVIIDKLPKDMEFLNEYYHGKYFIYNYYHNESWRTEFLKHYNLVLETERYLLFERVA